MDKQQIINAFRENKIDITDYQAQQFAVYCDFLLEYNEKVNLTAVTEVSEVIEKHFIDSVKGAELINENAKCADIGTGAGFPGVPLAIMRPDINVCLVDALNKRLVFLNELKEKLGLTNVYTVHGRSEDLGNPSLPFNNVVSFISFSTKRHDISYVILTSADETPIHGNGSVEIVFNEDTPAASFGSDTGAAIKVNLSGEGTYYITTLPIKLNDGFSISCYDSSDKLIGRAIGKNPLILNRSCIIRLGNIDGRLVDENGVRLDGYDEDIPWDPSEGTDADIDYGGYGDDDVWDSNGDSDGNISQGGYTVDYNWNSDSDCSGDVSKQGFEEDKNWNN